MKNNLQELTGIHLWPDRRDRVPPPLASLLPRCVGIKGRRVTLRQLSCVNFARTLIKS